MNEDLPDVKPLGYAPREAALPLADLRRMLAGLKPGRYRVADLWPRYVAWAERERRELVHPISVGLSMRELVGPTGVEVPAGHSGRVYKLCRWHVVDDAPTSVSTDPVG